MRSFFLSLKIVFSLPILGKLKKLRSFLLSKTVLEYAALLHWDILNRCNLDCEYCFDNPTKKTGAIPKIKISHLIRTLNETNKIYCISFTGGGEPFLIPNIVDACKEITKKHYICFYTNLTCKSVDKLVEEVNPERILFIHASLHIKELERHNLLSRYINNFKLCEKNGINIRASEVAYPSLLKEVKKYRELFRNNGIEIGFNPFTGIYKGRKYPDAYTNEELHIFGFSSEQRNTYNHRGTLCNAGYNVGIVYPNGDIVPCTQIKKSIGNIYETIEFNNKLIRCPFENCECPLKVIDPYLFQKALNENKKFLKIRNFMQKGHGERPST